MKKRLEFLNQVIEYFYNEAPGAPVEIAIYDIIGKDPFTGEGITAEGFRAMLLDAAPKKDRPLNLFVSSRGGSVGQGVTIRNELEMWPMPITTTITGVAASTSSWAFAPKKAKVLAFANSQVFIHEAMSPNALTADEHRDLADCLDKTSNQIASMYAERCKKSPEEMRQMMRKTALLTGDEAKNIGLIDELIGGTATRNLSPDEINQTQSRIAEIYNSVSQPGNGHPKNNQEVMNKKKLIALLNGLGVTAINGVTVTEETPIENLETALETATNELKTKAATKQAAAESPELADLRNQIKSLTEASNTARTLRITSEVDGLVANDQVTPKERDAAIKRALADETYLNELRERPAVRPGAAPISQPKLEVNAAPREILNAFERFNDPMKAWQRGNDVSAKAIANASIGKGQFYRKHREALTEMFLNVGVNTIPAGLQRQAILQEIIVDFERRLLPLNAFATNFQNVPLEGTNKVEIRYYDLDAGASTSWVDATGYAAGDTTTAVREIQVGNNGGNAALLCDRKYQGLSFTSEEMARQPYLNILQLAKLKADKLASDIITHVLGVITLANYGAASITKVAALFNSDDVAALKAACKLWPEAGRSLVLDSEYDAALLKDSAIKSALNFGGSEGIRDGRIPRLFGFDYREIPTIPANAWNLVGFAVFKSAILYAQAPVPPAQEVRNAGTTYEVMTGPAGVTLEYRTFGDNTLDTAKHFIEASYGFAKGNGGALKAIVSA